MARVIFDRLAAAIRAGRLGAGRTGPRAAEGEPARVAHRLGELRGRAVSATPASPPCGGGSRRAEHRPPAPAARARAMTPPARFHRPRRPRPAHRRLPLRRAASSHELRRLGWTVDVHGLPGRFPDADPTARDALHATLAALPAGRRVVDRWARARRPARGRDRACRAAGAGRPGAPPARRRARPRPGAAALPAGERTRRARRRPRGRSRPAPSPRAGCSTSACAAERIRWVEPGVTPLRARPGGRRATAAAVRRHRQPAQGPGPARARPGPPARRCPGIATADRQQHARPGLCPRGRRAHPRSRSGGPHPARTASATTRACARPTPARTFSCCPRTTRATAWW